MPDFQYMDGRRDTLANIFKAHGMGDVSVNILRMDLESFERDIPTMFGSFLMSTNHQDGTPVSLPDFHEFCRKSDEKISENGLFVVVSRDLTDGEWDKVGDAMMDYMKDSTDHGVRFSVNRNILTHYPNISS